MILSTLLIFLSFWSIPFNHDASSFLVLQDISHMKQGKKGIVGMKEQEEGHEKEGEATQEETTKK
jgi:hypothetical protein